MSGSRFGALVGAVAALVLLTPAAAFAHEQRQAGSIQFTVGWQHEPTYAGFENGVQLFLKDAKGKPIDDLGDPPTTPPKPATSETRWAKSATWWTERLSTCSASTAPRIRAQAETAMTSSPSSDRRLAAHGSVPDVPPMERST